MFNGAIYNHPQLRKELQGLGYSFHSEGDTEVVLKACDAWGADCVSRFKGMFAFAIWERDSGRTFFARDRLGIKPLHYSVDRSRLRFASTLPALLRAGGLDTSIDPVVYRCDIHVPETGQAETGLQGNGQPFQRLTIRPDRHDISPSRSHVRIRINRQQAAEPVASKRNSIIVNEYDDFTAGDVQPCIAGARQSQLRLDNQLHRVGC